VKTHGNVGQALSFIQSALGLCPDLPQALTDYGQLLAQQGEYEKAVQELEHLRASLLAKMFGEKAEPKEKSQ